MVENPETVLCLRGTVDTVSLRFVLRAGRQVAGSDPGCAFRIPAKGVSRQHVELVVDGDGCRFRDLGSKNGTTVNGEILNDGPLSAGDCLGLGPVELEVQEVPLDDTELAVSFPLEDRAHSGAKEPTTSVTRAHHGDRSVAWLRVVDRLSRRLLVAGTPELEEALEVLTTEAGASGAGIVECVDGAAPVVRAWSGSKVAETDEPHLNRAVKAACDGSASGSVESPLHIEALLLGDRGCLAVVLVECDLSEEVVAPLLAVTVRMASMVIDLPVARVSKSVAVPLLRFNDDEVRGRSEAINETYNQLRRLLKGTLPVLVAGETGVGKEHIVRVLHRSSDRAAGPFVPVNCAAIPAELLEAELFGIGRGVATGVNQRLGTFEVADGGVLFLDEIGDMSPSLQAKLLRALQEGVVHPVGSAEGKTVDVRVVAATNTDLEERMADGRFRRDLYYRLAGYVLDVPPLRRRKRDILPLMEHFMARVAEEIGKPVRGLTVKALRLLEAYPWPGNVRELEHEARRLVYVCGDGQAIDSTALPERIIHPPLAQPMEGDDLKLEARVEELERHLVGAAMVRAGGNKSRAAEILGVSRAGLRMKIERLGITVATKVDNGG